MDRDLWEFFVGHRPGWIVDFAKVLAFVGDETVLLPVTLLIAIVMLVRGLRTVAGLSPFIVMLSTSVVVALTKSLIGRERPPLAQRLVEVGSASMPSGHAAFAAALATVVWMTSERHPQAGTLKVCAATVAVAAGVARMVLGVHWASDVALGWLLGCVLGAGVVVLLRRRLQSVG
jgi:undecaprenyl-diphosphatase